jgi:hypothetical protein
MGKIIWALALFETQEIIPLSHPYFLHVAIKGFREYPAGQ